MDIFLDQIITENWSLADQTIVSMLRMLAAFFFAALAAHCYKAVQRRERVITDNLPYTMILFSVIVCGMMMMIGDSIARAFGLVGVLSMLRFRLNVKNPTEMAAVLFTITIGIACGMDLLFLAAVFTGLVIVIFYVLHLHKSVSYRLRRRLLVRTKTNRRTHDFLTRAATQYGLSYKILSMEDQKGDSAIWKLDVTFASTERLKSWQESLAEDKSLFFSEEKFEINLDLTQWKPDDKDERDGKEKGKKKDEHSAHLMTPILSGANHSLRDQPSAESNGRAT